VYGAKKKPGALLTAPRHPPWETGALLEVALSLGAFAKPLRFVTEVTAITELAGGPGYLVDLAVREMTSEAKTRLEMLVARQDLRSRRRTGSFGTTN
jgi:hypothetical protein